MEVISISDSPVQSSDVSCVAQTSSHSMNVNEDISISGYSPVKTSEVSSVKKSCSPSNLKQFLAKKRDDGISCDDACFDGSYEIQQEPHHLPHQLDNSLEVHGDNESNLSRKSNSPESR